MSGAECTCWPDACDEEGDPGCAYCRALDAEWPCPADIEAMADDFDVEVPAAPVDETERDAEE